MSLNRTKYIVLISFLVAGSISLSAQKRKEAKQLRVEQDLRQSEEYFIEGNKEYLLGRFDKSYDWLQRAYKIQPDNAAFGFKLSECYAQLNNLEKALSLAEKSASIDPKNKYYALHLAQLYERKKNYKEAIHVYERIIKHSAGNQEYLLNIANIQLFIEDYEGAIKSYNKLESIYGVNEEIVRQKQLLYLKQNRLDDAIGEWKKLIAVHPEDPNLLFDLANLLVVNNRNKEAKQLLEEHLVRNHDSPFANLMLYEIYKKEGEVTKANSELEKAFQSSQLNIDAKIAVVISMIRQFQSDTSIKAQTTKLGETLVKVHPTESKAYALNGDILAIQEKKQIALANYSRSVELDNSHFKIWQQIIFLASELNQQDTVIKYSEKAIEVFPTQPIFYYYGGAALAGKKQYEKALTQFDAGKKITVNNVELTVQFLSQMGDAYNALKKHSQSDSCYEEALKLEPENVHVLNNYSYYLSLRKDKLELAKRMCEKMIQKQPDEPAYLDTFGWVLYQLKDYTNAKIYIERALRKTGDATIVEHYGDILFQLGDKDSALVQWEKAKKGEGYSEMLNKKIADKKLYE